MSDNPEIVVREAARADIASLVDFNLSMASETEGRDLDSGRLRRGVEAVFEKPGRGTYFIAEADGEVAGGLLVTFEWSDWRDGEFWWVQSVYVRPRFRRLGVYRAMHGHIVALARRSGACGVRLYVDKENAKARAAYVGLGMRPTRYDMYEHDFVLAGHEDRPPRVT